MRAWIRLAFVVALLFFVLGPEAEARRRGGGGGGRAPEGAARAAVGRPTASGRRGRGRPTSSGRVAGGRPTASGRRRGRRRRGGRKRRARAEPRAEPARVPEVKPKPEPTRAPEVKPKPEPKPVPKPEPQSTTVAATPKPAAEVCDLERGKDCVARSLAACGVTNSFASCRKVYTQFCRDPIAVPDVTTCMTKRCSNKRCEAQPGKPGLTELCTRQVCSLQRGGCRLAPQSRDRCQRLAIQSCGAGYRYRKCRQIYANFCEAPVSHTNVRRCVKERCPRGCPHSVGLAGMRGLCAEQKCPFPPKSKEERDGKPTTTTRRPKPTNRPKPTRPPLSCEAKCRIKMFKSCGVGLSRAKRACRKNRFVGCVRRNSCNSGKPKPQQQRVEEIEPDSCEMTCRKRSFRMCGPHDRDANCRGKYLADCQRLHCGAPQCALDCRMQAFAFCGATKEHAECRSTFLEKCLPKRCCFSNCEKRALRVCGSAKCRDTFCFRCMKKNKCRRFFNMRKTKKRVTTPAPTTPKDPCINERTVRRCKKLCRSHPRDQCTQACVELGEGRRVCSRKCRDANSRVCRRKCYLAREQFNTCTTAPAATRAPDVCHRRRLVRACDERCIREPASMCKKACVKIDGGRKERCSRICSKASRNLCRFQCRLAWDAYNTCETTTAAKSTTTTVATTTATTVAPRQGCVNKCTWKRSCRTLCSKAPKQLCQRACKAHPTRQCRKYCTRVPSSVACKDKCAASVSRACSKAKCVERCSDVDGSKCVTKRSAKECKKRAVSLCGTSLGPKALVCRHFYELNCVNGTTTTKACEDNAMLFCVYTNQTVASSNTTISQCLSLAHFVCAKPKVCSGHFMRRRCESKCLTKCKSTASATCLKSCGVKKRSCSLRCVTNPTRKCVDECRTVNRGRCRRVCRRLRGACVNDCTTTAATTTTVPAATTLPPLADDCEETCEEKQVCSQSCSKSPLDTACAQNCKEEPKKRCIKYCETLPVNAACSKRCHLAVGIKCSRAKCDNLCKSETCDVTRSREQCTSVARANCGTGVTAKSLICRHLYVLNCVKGTTTNRACEDRVWEKCVTWALKNGGRPLNWVRRCADRQHAKCAEAKPCASRENCARGCLSKCKSAQMMTCNEACRKSEGFRTCHSKCETSGRAKCEEGCVLAKKTRCVRVCKRQRQNCVKTCKSSKTTTTPVGTPPPTAPTVTTGRSDCYTDCERSKARQCVPNCQAVSAIRETRCKEECNATDVDTCIDSCDQYPAGNCRRRCAVSAAQECGVTCAKPTKGHVQLCNETCASTTKDDCRLHCSASTHEARRNCSSTCALLPVSQCNSRCAALSTDVSVSDCKNATVERCERKCIRAPMTSCESPCHAAIAKKCATQCVDTPQLSHCDARCVNKDASSCLETCGALTTLDQCKSVCARAGQTNRFYCKRRCRGVQARRCTETCRDVDESGCKAECTVLGASKRASSPSKCYAAALKRFGSAATRSDVLRSILYQEACIRGYRVSKGGLRKVARSCSTVKSGKGFRLCARRVASEGLVAPKVIRDCQKRCSRRPKRICRRSCVADMHKRCESECRLERVSRCTRLCKGRVTERCVSNCKKDPVAVCGSACKLNARASCINVCALKRKQRCSRSCASLLRRTCKTSCKRAPEVNCRRYTRFAARASCVRGCQVDLRKSCSQNCVRSSTDRCVDTCKVAPVSSCNSLCLNRVAGECLINCKQTRRSACTSSCVEGAEASCKKGCRKGPARVCSVLCTLAQSEQCITDCKLGVNATCSKECRLTTVTPHTSTSTNISTTTTTTPGNTTVPPIDRNAKVTSSSAAPVRTWIVGVVVGAAAAAGVAAVAIGFALSGSAAGASSVVHAGPAVGGNISPLYEAPINGASNPLLGQ